MSKKIQLFLLPFAGGSSLSFSRLIGLLGGDIEAITIEYAGRGTRRKDAFITEYDAFVSDVIEHIEGRRNSDMPYALLGYSMGSALTFDIASKNLLGEEPVHLFICARGSLREKSPSQDYVALSEADFVDKITALGGVDRRIVQNKRFRDIYFEPLSADYRIWSQYRYDNEHGSVNCDVTVMYSNKDKTCINPRGWTELTAGDVEFHEMGENHFFINEHYEDMAKIINSRLLTVCGDE